MSAMRQAQAMRSAPMGQRSHESRKTTMRSVTNDDYCHIQGNSRATIDKGLRVRVNSKGAVGNNYNIEVGQGNVNVEVNGGNINMTTLNSGADAGDININASRDLNIEVGGDMNVNVIGAAIENVAKTKDEFVVGNNTKTGKRIDLN